MVRIRGELYVNLKDVAKETGVKYDNVLLSNLDKLVKVSKEDDVRLWLKCSNDLYFISYLAIYRLFKYSDVDYHKADKLFQGGLDE